MKKKFLLFILSLSISLICCSCQNPIVVKRRPCSQPNTIWVSDDEKITFTVHDNNCANGKMIINGETIEFHMTNDMGSGMHIYPTTVLENNIIDETTKYEYWLCSYKSDKEFIALVKETTFFNVDQKLVFRKQSVGQGRTGDGSVS